MPSASSSSRREPPSTAKITGDADADARIRSARVVMHWYPDRSWLDREDAWQTTAGDREDHDLCIRRERWQERACLRLAGMPSAIVIGSPPGGVRISGGARSDPDAGLRFLDGDGRPFDPAGRHILLRALADHAPLERAIAAAGGVSVSSHDGMPVETWPAWIDQTFLKRRVSIIDAGRLRAHLERRDDGLMAHAGPDGYVFLKTLAKDGHGHVRIHPDRLYGDMWDTIGSHLERVGDRHPFIISEPVRFVEDGASSPKLEWRCQVVDDVPVTWSRYVDHEDLPVPDDIRACSVAFAAAHADRTPAAYVVDIGMTTDRGPVVVELNGMPGSGRYAGNRADAMFAAMFGPDDAMRSSLRSAWDTVMKEDAERLGAIVPVPEQPWSPPDLDMLLGRLDVTGGS